MFWRTALLCLLICSIGRAYFHLPMNSNYDFSRCAGSTCRSGQSIGYGCSNGNCTYVCSDGFCSGYKGYQGVLPPISHEFLVRPWGYGVVRRQGGCNGGNCGYWGGCMNEYCGGYYDFRGCPHMDCKSGPFHGYGCRNGNCEIVCNGRNCYIESTYGTEPKRCARNKTFENEPRAPSAYRPYNIQQYEPVLEDIGETFSKKDMWMLRNLNPKEIFELVKSWVKDPNVFNKMKPDGEEVKFILSQFRKRNRMQTRLELWREGKKAQMYFDTLCPYKHNQFYECPYPNQFPPMIPYQQCPQLPPGQYAQQPRMPYHSPFHPPQSYYNPRRYNSWAGGCPGWNAPMTPYHPWQKPPMIPPPVYPQAQPWAPPSGNPHWAPPQVPINCPGGCPWHKPPMISPQPLNPQAQPWAPSPFNPQAQPWAQPPGSPRAHPWAPPPGRPQALPWAPPQVPIKCPPECQCQKPPMIPPQPLNPQAQPWALPPGSPQAHPWVPPPGKPQALPWAPPQVPIKCPPECQCRRPPMIPPQPLNPQAQPWAPSPVNPQAQPWALPPGKPQAQHWAPPSGKPQSQPWVPPQEPSNVPGWQMPPKTPPSTWRKPPMMLPHPGRRRGYYTGPLVPK